MKSPLIITLPAPDPAIATEAEAPTKTKEANNQIAFEVPSNSHLGAKAALFPRPLGRAQAQRKQYRSRAQSKKDAGEHNGVFALFCIRPPPYYDSRLDIHFYEAKKLPRLKALPPAVSTSTLLGPSDTFARDRRIDMGTSPARNMEIRQAG